MISKPSSPYEYTASVPVLPLVSVLSGVAAPPVLFFNHWCSLQHHMLGWIPEWEIRIIREDKLIVNSRAWQTEKKKMCLLSLSIPDVLTSLTLGLGSLLLPVSP